jgi:hypothetical protein
MKRGVKKSTHCKVCNCELTEENRSKRKGAYCIPHWKEVAKSYYKMNRQSILEKAQTRREYGSVTKSIIDLINRQDDLTKDEFEHLKRLFVKWERHWLGAVDYYSIVHYYLIVKKYNDEFFDNYEPNIQINKMIKSLKKYYEKRKQTTD